MHFVVFSDKRWQQRRRRPATTTKDDNEAEDDQHYHRHTNHDADPLMTNPVLLSTTCYFLPIVLIGL